MRVKNGCQFVNKGSDGIGWVDFKCGSLLDTGYYLSFAHSHQDTLQGNSPGLYGTAFIPFSRKAGELNGRSYGGTGYRLP